MAVSPDGVPEAARLQSDLDLPFTLLSDDRRRAAALFGVTVGHDIAPSAFLLDRRGRVQWAFVGSGPEDQPALSGVMSALRSRARLVFPAPSDVLTPAVTTLVVVLLGLLGLLSALAHRHLLAWDRPLRSNLRNVDSDAFHSLMEIATKFGSRSIIAFLTVPAVLLAWRRCRQLAIVFVAAFPTALVLELILKALIDRPRPAFAVGFGASFPSGHVLAATAFWGLIPPLVYITTRSRIAWSVSVASIALVLLGVGTSRVYLGAHWPSDVAGALLGGAMFLLVAEWVVRRPWRRLRCEACDLHPLVGSGPPADQASQ